MTCFEFLIKLLTPGVFSTMKKVNAQHQHPENLSPADVANCQRKAFNAQVNAVIKRNPVLLKLANQAAGELLFDALWEQFCAMPDPAKETPTADPAKETPTADAAPDAPKAEAPVNPLENLTPEQAMVTGIVGGVLATMFNNENNNK